MKSGNEMGPLVWGLVLGLALLLGGCTAPAGGGDGDDGGEDGVRDPLPDYQLGQDEDLDADVAAITEADNDILECIGRTLTFTDEDVLEDLKNGYVASPGIAPTFEDFVSDVAAIETSKRDQICDTEAGDDEDLDAALERIVDAEVRADECRGEEASATVDDALLNVKALFFEEGIATTDLVAFAEQMADQAEQEADEVCAEGGG